MKHLLFVLLRFAVVFLASSIVFFALVVVAAHLLTPYFNHRGQTIERFVSELLHKPVQMGQFRVSWRGLSPVLQGRQVTVWNDSKTQPLLQIKEGDVGIDIFKTLLTGNIKLADVKLSGLELVIHQTKDNQFIVKGMSSFVNPENESTQGFNEILGWLLVQPSLSLQDIVLVYTPASDPKWPAMRLNAILKNKQDHHQLSANLQFLEPQSSRLTLMADLTGSYSAPTRTTLKGPIYLQGQSILLDRWLALLNKKYSLKNGIVNFKVWADWQQDHFIYLHALVDSLRKSLFQAETQPPFNIMPFSANVEWKGKEQASWSVNTIVRNLAFSPWNKIPGIKGLNVYCHITPLSGNLIARSKNLEIDFMKLFKAPLHFDNLASELHWQRRGDGTLIQVEKFDVANADVAANGQMGLFIPTAKISPQMSLLAHVKTVQPSHIGDYLPLPFVGPQLVRWLNSALVKGFGDGTVLLQGPLAEFPFDKNDGTFLIDTQIKNTELHYEADWPNLQKINGELVFLGRQMQLFVNSAQIFSTPLKDIKATIPLIKSHVQAVLHIAPTTINTRLENGLAFLQTTPLAKEIGSLSGILLAGPLKLALQLTIPLESGKEKLTVAGLGTVENATAKIPAHDIQIDNLKGQFSLSQTGVQAQNLLGLLWNKPITIAIRSTPSTELAINYEGIQTLLNPEKKGWRFVLNNKMVQGSVLIPNNKTQAIEANFSSIHLNATASQSQWNIEQIPKINLQAKDVQYNNMDFGALQLKLRPILAGVGISELQAGNSSYHLIASGAWHRQENKHTELVGQLDSPDLSGFLRNLGLPASITAEQAHMRFNLRWPGAPYDMNLAQLRGNFSFSATNGQIVDVGSSAEAKISFGRLLIFLSLQSLGRRLQLDFSDLKGKGFDFTSLQGHFNLRGGNAYTQDVAIEGPVAAITITGRVGLQAKDYDLIVKVVPHFTSSLPVIVGLAGGPIAGAITWVANTVLGSTVQKIAETSYRINGSWGKPEVVKTSK